MTKTQTHEVRIVIAQRGWVFVGRWARADEHVTLTDASVIRRWGTTRGLGELIAGPLANTVLDPCGTVELHDLAVVASIQCDADRWHLEDAIRTAGLDEAAATIAATIAGPDPDQPRLFEGDTR